MKTVTSLDWRKRFAKRTDHMKRTAVRELLKLTAQPGMILFAGGLPAPEFFPIQRAKAAAQWVLTDFGKQALQYRETEGVAELRDWIARRFSCSAHETGRRTGVPPVQHLRTPDTIDRRQALSCEVHGSNTSKCFSGKSHFQLDRSRVVITSGGQQALDLIGRVLLNENDKVAVENPTYLALLSAWRRLGVQFLPVSSDNDGMRVNELEAVLQGRPKLVYSVPTFQNPQGTTLGLERRLQLVELLREYDVGLVEDDPYSELRYSGAAMPTILELDAKQQWSDRQDGNVIYVGTFSKVLMPGLRVGWIIAPEEVIERIVRAKQAADLHTSTLSQHIAWELARDGFLNEHIPLLQRAYRERRDVMVASLEKHFPTETSWTRPDGGMFLMVTLPKAFDAFDALKEALKHHVAFVPGEEFHLQGLGRKTFRLNFSNAQPGLIEEGVKRLGKVLKQMIAR